MPAQLHRRNRIPFRTSSFVLVLLSRQRAAVDAEALQAYRRALREIEGLMMAKRNSPEGDRLDVLVTLVEAWEQKHYPMDRRSNRRQDAVIF